MQKVNKLNPSIDIIPLQGTSNDKPKLTGNKHKTDVSQPRYGDPLLIARVQKYMFENEDKTYIDVNEMADELQRKHRDYRYKKRGAFRSLVHEAYDELTAMFSKKCNDCSVYDDEDEENEIDIESEPQSPMSHDMLLKGYGRIAGKQNGNSSDKELIDISSDDDAAKVEFSQDNGKDKNMKKFEFSKENSKQGNAIKTKNNTVEIRSVVSDAQALTNEAKISVKGECSQTQMPSNTETHVSIAQTENRKRPRRRDTSFIVGKKSRTILLSEPKYTFADIGGCDNILKRICRLLGHIKHPEAFNEVGILISRGFLIHGPPGCGKTLLAHAIAGELAVPLLKITGQELGNGESYENELRIRELFDQATTIAPCVLFLDDIDKALTETKIGKKIITRLLTFFDEMSLTRNGDKIVVIGTTRYPDSIDPDLRRTGCFDQEISLGIPNRDARAKILALHTKNITLSPDVSLSTIASFTPGFIGADLVSLIQEAATVAINRVFEEGSTTKTDKNVPDFENNRNLINDNVTLEPSTSTQAPVPTLEKTTGETDTELEMDVIRESSKSPDLSEWVAWLHDEPPLSPERLSRLCIRHCDFETALRVIQPSAHREGLTTVPDVTWDDIGSHRDIKEELRMAILSPIRHSERFSALDLTTPTGIMLCGPPGCGKTLLVKAIANEAGINFISVKGPELLNRCSSESAKAIRQCFIRAKNSVPCIMFFEELEALCPRKSESDNNTSRITSQMISEMDGIKGQGIILMAASNRPDIIDPAVFRSGRLDKIIYVGLPTAADRVDILRTLTKNGTKPKLADDVTLEGIGYNNKCEGYTGADLATLIRESKYEAVKEITAGFTDEIKISMRHFVFAFDKVQSSVREKDIEYYENLRKLYSTKKTFDKGSTEMPLDPPISDTGMEPMET